MFLIFLIKNMCLLAFYFAYATLLFVQPVHQYMIVAYLIILASISLSYVFKSNKKFCKLKYVPLIGIILAIFYLRTITGAIAVISPYVYMYFVIKNDDYYIDYSNFKSLFFKLLIAIIALMLTVFLIGWFGLFKRISLQYVLIFLICGIYLMRTSRHSKEVITSKAFTIINILIILGTCVICVLLSSKVVINAFIYVMKLIYEKIIITAIIGLTYVVMGISFVFVKILLLFADPNNSEDLKAAEEMAEQVENATSNFIYSDNYYLTLSVLAYALTAIFCLILLKVFISKRKRISGKEEVGVIQYRSIITDSNKPRKKDKPIFRNSVNQIRHWYKKFLLLCGKKHIELHANDSSQTIYEKSCDVFDNSKEELEEIKNIYRKARYSSEIVDNQDIKKFKAIYKKLENEKNN